MSARHIHYRRRPSPHPLAHGVVPFIITMVSLVAAFTVLILAVMP